MGKPFILAIIATAILLSGCTQQPNPGKTTVASGDTISVEYKGTLQDGTEFDSSEGKQPLEFVAGTGQMIQGFDATVIGMALDEEKTVTIPPEKAYGQYDNTKLVELPKSQFADPDKMVVGLPVHASNGVNGVVTEIKDDSIVVDFNHPLAGKTLTFWIKVVKIVKA